MNEDECKARRDAVLAAVKHLYKQHERPLKIKEIADLANVSKSAAHRYIVWLWANQQLDRTQDGKHGSIVPAGFGQQW
jgi:response regulator of citrate/malate metabolism